MFVTYPAWMIERCSELTAAGATIASIAEELRVGKATVVRWRQKTGSAALRAVQMKTDACPVCRVPKATHLEIPGGRYAYALGVYLGDGCLSTANNKALIRVYMDAQYADIIEETVRSLAGLCLTGKASVYRPAGRNDVVIASYGRRWLCLFPQHGPGKKHLRKIALEPWQQTIVDNYPGPFLRGLIHTDGWRGENRVTAKGRDYSYPRYQFSSRSDDIRQLFTEACDRLEIKWRPWGRWHISVAQKDAVALLDEHVGLKT